MYPSDVLPLYFRHSSGLFQGFANVSSSGFREFFKWSTLAGPFFLDIWVSARIVNGVRWCVLRFFRCSTEPHLKIYCVFVWCIFKMSFICYLFPMFLISLFFFLGNNLCVSSSVLLVFLQEYLCCSLVFLFSFRFLRSSSVPHLFFLCSSVTLQGLFRCSFVR